MGSLIALDPRSKIGEFRITCGWDSLTRRKIRPGVWRMDLRGTSLELTSEPNNLAGGYVQTVSYAKWKAYVVEFGWTGIIERNRQSFLTDGPGTDVCNGVMG